jgi:hypothetical protein
VSQGAAATILVMLAGGSNVTRDLAIGRLDPILYGIIAVFVAWEGVAHYLLHNTSGHTLSNRIGWLEHRGPAWVQLIIRIVVAAAVVLLGVHLELFP